MFSVMVIFLFMIEFSVLSGVKESPSDKLRQSGFEKQRRAFDIYDFLS